MELKEGNENLAMKIYLLRHGETDWNIEGRLQGRMDIPMNERGKEQIASIGLYLNENRFCVNQIISSPLLRARETAGIVSESIGYVGNILYDELLLERGFGKLEGELWSPQIDLNDPKHGIESVEVLCQRARKVLLKYVDEKDILVIAHGAIIKAIVAALTEGKVPYEDNRIFIKQGDILWGEVDEKGYVGTLSYLIGGEVFEIGAKNEN